MTLGLTFLSLMSACWWKSFFLNPKKLVSLTVRDTLERSPKVIGNQNLFSRFQSWCWFWCWSWCWNFAEKNQASNQDWSSKFWGWRVFHYSLVGVVLLPSVKKWPNLHPLESPPRPTSKFLHSPNFYIIIIWSWKLKSKN